ncbi:hypothetical protein TTHERM_001212879 (macronuclear) [Tetrahymena thermophila SB210]|uniref:Uncharacterized protein n=1 Tax=Tetrahymena thermophila (strain SB210) TaxID=312017 RepID=W7XAU9_TETTS|nr:hypothetical protein TTHERM_001212879 [Tetrahymena thermophila SB210]EWS73548.1 hypothetical protein TTHERM_001212879 [Tetrahymena thermophila SB210]|eukprot:XP_012653938.1 hypothetical protein TTHERM_001212879 [Tetrahymena thermophila SB210]
MKTLKNIKQQMDFQAMNKLFKIHKILRNFFLIVYIQVQEHADQLYQQSQNIKISYLQMNLLVYSRKIQIVITQKNINQATPNSNQQQNQKKKYIKQYHQQINVILKQILNLQILCLEEKRKFQEVIMLVNSFSQCSKINMKITIT